MSDYTDLEAWYIDLEGLRKITTKTIHWDIGKKNSGFRYQVKPGFVFDVSVPRALHWLLNPNDPRFMKAACLHDHMLVAEWTRPAAAGVFHDAIKADGVSATKRLIMFIAVAIWKWD